MRKPTESLAKHNKILNNLFDNKKFLTIFASAEKV